MSNTAIDFNQLNEAANNAETLQAILSDAYGVSLNDWRKRGNSYHARGRDGINIFSNKEIFLVKDWSTATIGTDKTTNALGLVKLAYGLTGKEAAEKLATFTGKHLEYTTQGYAPSTDKGAIPTSSFVLPNTGEYKVYYDLVEYCDFTTDYGKAVLAYLMDKTKADESFIKQYYTPIAATTKEGKKTVYNPYKFAFSVVEGQQSKIFRPYLKANKIGKLPLIMGKNWLFGFANLPLKCNYIFLLAGENDTVAFNYAFNKLGWYGITKGGEGYDYDPQLIKLLQARCNAVFCLFDNDKTGNASMEKHTLKHGLQGIDLATYINDKERTSNCEFDENGINLTVNDVCDFLDVFDAQRLEELIEVEIRTKKAESILPYRPTFSNVWVTKFDAYLCDNPIEYGLFKNYIHIVRKLIFSALTGTGKTTVFLKRIANDTAFLAENGIERIVYLTPTNSIGKQQELEHKIPFITSLHKENSDEINQSKVIAWTYDQVHKIPSHWLNDTLFVCDEMHTVITEFGYRKETMRGITDLLEKAKFFVGITATPNKEFIKKFNLSYCVAQYNDKNKAQKINITPILIKKGSAKDLTQDIIARRNKTKTTVIIHNNFNELLAFKDALTQKFGNDAITLISSKEHEFCRDNANYESLKRTGKVSAKTQFILTTKFLEAGVNFAFDSEIFCVHPESTVSLLQGVARPRIDRKTGVNSTVNCFVYLSTTNLDKALLDNSITRFQSFLDGKGYDIPPSVLAHLSDLKTAFENAEKICIAWNVVNDNTTREHIEKANRFDVFFNTETRLWEIDKLGILSKVETNLQGNLKKDIVSFFAEIKALNENVTIQPLELISLKKDLEVRTIYDNLKTEKAESIDTVAQALTNAQSQKDILLIAYAESNNKALKTGILDTMLDQTPTKPEIEAAKQRTQFNAKDGGVICEVTTKYLGILEAAKTVRYANGTKPISQTDIDTNFSHLIQNYDLANNRLIRLGQRLMCERNHQERQDIDDFYEGKMSNAIRKRVFEATTKNKHKNPILNKTQMTNIYNESLRAVYLEMNIKKAPPSERKFEVVRQTFLELFSIETRRNKNGYFYKFGDEITAKNAVLVSSYT